MSNKDGPEMIVVPRGRFLMGSPASEKGRCDGEDPVHEVSIDYCLAVGKYPVTRGEWRRYVDETGRQSTGELDWLNPSFPPDNEQDDQHPVVCISWEDAQAYITWLNEKTGRHHRMLSEAEYEYINRAGTSTRYFWGDSDEDLKLYANRNGRGTTRVGSWKPNPWGLYDTTGNVWSFTQDTYQDDYNGAPTDGSAWEADTSSNRVVRGGSWADFPWLLRSACRAWCDCAWYLGLRLARTL
jgi:formylglycine-generating enzyme required for sulfatase activity